MNAAAQAFTQSVIWLLQSKNYAVSPECAQILHESFLSRQEGHTWLPLSAAQQQALPDTHLWRLRGARFYWQKDDAQEASVARMLSARAHTQLPIDVHAANWALERAFGQSDATEQKLAAALTLIHPLMLISGGPGTGKTTTVAKILWVLQALGLARRVVLTAPTGKAAAHMSRTLRRSLQSFPASIQAALNTIEGVTLHRLLGLGTQHLSRYRLQDKLPADVVVVDEASMLDLPLLQQLLLSLPEHCRLVLLGDANQLPAVGIGHAFAAMSGDTALSQMDYSIVHALLPNVAPMARQADSVLSGCRVELTVSHRFKGDSAIGKLASQMVSGSLNADVFDEKEVMQRPFQAQEWCAWLYARQHAYWQAVDSGQYEAVFQALDEVMTLTALREDAEKLNQIYVRWLANKRTLGEYFAGKMILIEQNDYHAELFNGDIGVILPNENGDLRAVFEKEGGHKTLGLARLPQHSSAFAMTVHKSQGSEYQCVGLMLNEHASGSLNRALVYTAVTRAREQFVLWGDIDALQQAVQQPLARRQGLSERLASHAFPDTPSCAHHG